MIFDDFLKIYQKRVVTQYSNTICKNPSVSISVVTFQHANYIKKCLDGILMQKTNFHYEILLGEDNGTDETRNICIEYAEKFPDKIRLFLHHRENNIKINGNPTGRFNFIYNLYNSRGKYIAFCEGDDYWTDPLKLQKQVNFLEANDDYVIHSGAAKIIRDNQLKDEIIGFDTSNKTFSIEDFYSQNNLVTCTVMFRNCIKGVPKIFTKVTFGDWLLYVLLLHKTNKKAFRCTSIFSVYRIHDKGIMMSLSTINDHEAHINQIIKIKKLIVDKNYLPLEISRLNNYSIEKFKIELYNKSYYALLNTFFKNFLNCKLDTPVRKYLSAIKQYYIH